ncbi:hypothetical protein INT46_002669 [Mucor plumbeus]|uniref:C2H2-type domain-containing protein n=1 Tax=Mucor plumbeus TaxID=97098 RepID=A0A8H7V187_9FUNG|nr:hypothetical protein INT46_002669 [Mucor plumbeus]
MKQQQSTRPLVTKKYEILLNDLIKPEKIKQEDLNEKIDNNCIIKPEVLLEVKQEVTEKSEIPSNQIFSKAAAPSNIPYHYKCRYCGEKKPEFSLLLEHLESVHNFEFNGISIKNIKLEPDVQDPNHSCRTCERKFKSRISYRTHLRKVHSILMKPIDVLPKHNTTSTDPDLYCNLCHTSYYNQSYIQHHFRSVHSDILPKLNNTDSHCIPLHDVKPTMSNLLDKVCCEICKVAYKNEEIHGTHCNRHSDLTKPNPITINLSDNSKESEEIEPDINDPNNYCRACDKTFTKRWGFKCHLQSAHSIKIPSKSRTNVDSGFTVPNIDDPNHYCRVCIYKFQCRTYYRHHLRLKHKLTIRLMRAYPDPDAAGFQLNCRVCKSPFNSIDVYRKHCVQYHGMSLEASASIIDAHDPNFNCAMCDIRYETKSDFAEHLRKVHKERRRDRQKFPNPDATIDMFDPNFYCAVCDKHLFQRITFVVHLENVHDLIVPTI